MKIKANRTLFITTALCFLPIIFGILVYNKLPDNIPIHFDGQGNPDNFWGKDLTVFGLPVFMSLINLYTHFRLNKDPKVNNTSFSLRHIAKWVIPVISIIFIPALLLMSMGMQLSIVKIASVSAGLIIVLLGNYLPKCRQNYTVGYKLPWTLDNERNWNKTHRFAGFIWVIGGIIIIINTFFNIPFITLFIIIILITAPSIYSYLMYRMVKK